MAGADDIVQRSILEALPVGVVVQGARGEVLAANELGASLLDVDLDELLAHRVGLPLGSVVRLDGSIVQPGELPARRAIESGVRQTGFELGVTRADGSVRWLEVTSTPLTRRGELEPSVVISTVSDLTDRVEAEAAALRFSSIVELASESIVSTDLDGTITSWNQGAEAVYGYGASEVVGRQVWLLAPDDARQAELAQLLDRVAGGQRVSNLITEWRRKDGRMVTVSVSLAPMLDGEGRVSGISAFTSDVTERLRLLNQAQEDRASLIQAQHVAGVGSFEYDLASRVWTWSAELCRIIGEPEDAVASPELYLSHVHADDLETVLAQQAAVPRSMVPIEGSHRLVRHDGEVRWVEARVERLLDAHDRPYRVVGTVLDVTDRVLAEEARRRAEVRFRLGFEQSRVGVAMLDLEGRLTEANPPMCEMLGRPAEEVVGVGVEELRPEVDRSGGLFELFAGVREHLEAEAWFDRPDGERSWLVIDASLVRDAEGRPDHVFVQAQDATERKRAQDELAHQLVHDPLTGLPNRILLADRLANALQRAGPAGRRVVVLFFDLDHFKLVNDALGRRAGDQVLVEVGRRLQAAARPGDTVACFGGDEFVVMAEVSGGDEPDELLRALGSGLAASFEVDGNELFLTASVGMATADHGDPEAVLLDADAALVAAKAGGRARVQAFDESLRVVARDRLDLESALRAALDRGELRLVYQPILELATTRVVGTEALLRWDHPERGLISPVEFIPVAEEAGLIVPIGAWTVDAALAQMADWRRRLPEVADLFVSVNLSPRQLAEPDLVEMVAGRLAAWALGPGVLHLEVTETALMLDVEAAIVTLQRLRGLGIPLAIDDFGTGYSSLSYLKRLPIDVLKIDRSFVDGLGADADDSAIVEAVVGLGRALHLSLLAEGVETDGQAARLRALGCQLGQGFLWSRPLPPAELEAFLVASRLDPVGPVGSGREDR